jgi:hypothetical protein
MLGEAGQFSKERNSNPDDRPAGFQVQRSEQTATPKKAFS